MRLTPVCWIWIDLDDVEQESDAVKVTLGRGQMERSPAVVVRDVQVDVAQPGPEKVGEVPCLLVGSHLDIGKNIRWVKNHLVGN